MAAHLHGDEEAAPTVNGTRYRRLPGTRRGLFMRSSAWLQADHILLVEGSRVSENYKRIYLRDVQAMLVMKRPRFLIQSPWLLAPPALAIAVSRVPAGSQETAWLLAGLALVAILVYLYVAAFSYGCRFYLATAVGNVYVPSVFRVWQARRFSALVQPLILEAQRPEG